MTELSRRTVLRGGAAAAVGVGASWALAGSAAHAGPAQVEAVFAPQPDTTVVAALDLDVSGAAEVRSVLRELDRRLRRLGVETMLAVGASLFERAGLEPLRPAQLTAMPAFAGDALDPARCHGDVLVSVGGSALPALPGVSVRWSVSGFHDHVRPGVSRNLFGFTEGHGNPHGGQAPGAVVVRPDQGEPSWAVGGTYQVVRVIRFATELWDKDPVDQQERIIGRRRDGRWLDGTRAAAQPVFQTDPGGRVTPLDAHVRLTREPGGGRAELLRRGYSYRTEREEGLLFVAYQRDLERGFAGVQRRLAGEPLSRYTLTVGGGYFFLPPAGWRL